jgi:hypothetical protein
MKSIASVGLGVLLLPLLVSGAAINNREAAPAAEPAAAPAYVWASSGKQNLVKVAPKIGPLAAPAFVWASSGRKIDPAGIRPVAAPAYVWASGGIAKLGNKLNPVAARPGKRDEALVEERDDEPSYIRAVSGKKEDD